VSHPEALKNTTSELALLSGESNAYTKQNLLLLLLLIFSPNKKNIKSVDTFWNYFTLVFTTVLSSSSFIFFSSKFCSYLLFRPVFRHDPQRPSKMSNSCFEEALMALGKLWSLKLLCTTTFTLCQGLHMSFTNTTVGIVFPTNSQPAFKTRVVDPKTGTICSTWHQNKPHISTEMSKKKSCALHKNAGTDAVSSQMRDELQNDDGWFVLFRLAQTFLPALKLSDSALTVTPVIETLYSNTAFRNVPLPLFLKSPLLPPLLRIQKCDYPSPVYWSVDETEKYATLYKDWYDPLLWNNLFYPFWVKHPPPFHILL